MDVTEHMLLASDDPDLDRSSLDNIILSDAMNCLPLDQQAVLGLDIVGFRQWEISKILGISRTTVWSKKTQALGTLRQYITGALETCQDKSTDA